MKKILFILLAIAAHLHGKAQTPFADSLQLKLTTAKEDTNKVYLFTDIADEITDINFDKSIEFANKGLALAEKLQFKRGIAQAYSTLGNAYSDHGDYNKCLEVNNKALGIRKELNNQRDISKSLCNIGNAYNDLGNYTKTLEFYQQSLVIDTKAGDKKSLALLYNNMGNVYANKGDLKQATELMLKSLKIKEELGNKKGVANTQNNIAVIYKMQGNMPEALQYNRAALKTRMEIKDSMGMGYSYTNIGLVLRKLMKDDEAEENYLKAYAIFKRLGFSKGIASANNNLGNIYTEKKQYTKALPLFTEALQISKEQNDKAAIATTESSLAQVYGKMGNTTEAEKYFTDAIALAKETQSIETLMNVYNMYSAYYEDKNDFKKSLGYHKLYTQFKDSLQNKDNAQALAEMKTRFETEAKEKENSLLAEDNELKSAELSKSHILTAFLVFGILFVLVVSVLVYNRNKLKQKAVLDAELLKQQEIRSKAIIEAEEKERVRIARELHDGIGQQLSAAKLNMSSLQSIFQAENEEQRTMFQNAVDLLDESVKEVRTVSHSMMPNALIKSGLAGAVREFVNKVSSSSNIKINLELVGLGERLENTVETVLFRVLQEIVSNIIKHAQATTVSIQLLNHQDELVLLVEDNGIGFDVKKAEMADGIGLKNIQSRVAYLNGSVDFDSHPGRGTTVNIEIPLV